MDQLSVTPDQMDDILDLSKDASSIAYSSNGIRAYFITIGPELAKKILATYSTDYRKYRQSHVDTISRDMKNGNWNLDGSPIRINENAELADGQHRLHSVIESGLRLEFLVVDSLPVSTYDTMDTNALTRTFIDILRRKGYTHCSSRAALTKLVYYWEYRNTLDARLVLTVSQLDEIHDKYEKRISWAVHNANNLDRKVYIKRSLIALAFFILGEVSEASIKGLMISVADASGITRGMPAYALWNRLRNDHNSEKEKLRTNDETMYLIFRAWKTYHQNTMRHESDQLELNGSIPIPASGVTVRDLKNMMVTE